MLLPLCTKMLVDFLLGKIFSERIKEGRFCHGQVTFAGQAYSTFSMCDVSLLQGVAFFSNISFGGIRPINTETNLIILYILQSSVWTPSRLKPVDKRALAISCLFVVHHIIFEIFLSSLFSFQLFPGTPSSL